MTDTEKDRKAQLVKDYVQRLSAHFDTVQIFVTKDEPTSDEGTIHIVQGNGNWFARYGQVCDWVDYVRADRGKC